MLAQASHYAIEEHHQTRPRSGAALRAVPALPAPGADETLDIHAFARSRGFRVDALAPHNHDEVKDYIIRMRQLWNLEGRLLAGGHGDLELEAHQNRGHLFILRDDSNDIVGTAAYSQVDEAVCEMTKLYVRPLHQGVGIGSALRRAVEDAARRDGYDSVVLDTLDIWSCTIAAYRSWGYAQFGRRDVAAADLRAGSRELKFLDFVKSLVGPTHACPGASRELAKEFTDDSQLDYARAYNRAIRTYSGWREMLGHHLSAIRPDAEVVWDVGGGTGRMTERVLQSGRSTVVLDRSPLMLHLAASDNGLSPSRLHLCDALDPRIGSSRSLGAGARPLPDSVDHVLSHSMLWMLEDPREFFGCYARVLRQGGRLSLSTILPETSADAFIASLARDLRDALRRPRPFGLDRRTAVRVVESMAGTNRAFASATKNTWSTESLRRQAASAGLHLVPESVRTGYAGTMGFWTFEKV